MIIEKDHDYWYWKIVIIEKIVVIEKDCDKINSVVIQMRLSGQF